MADYRAVEKASIKSPGSPILSDECGDTGASASRPPFMAREPCALRSCSSHWNGIYLRGRDAARPGSDLQAVCAI